MLRNWILFAVLLSSAAAQALSVEFVLGGGVPFLSREVRLDQTRSAGSVSAEVLTQAAVDFVGDESGIHSIHGRGGELEVISNRKMRAYGWCFSVNGIVPPNMPDKVLLDPANDQNAKIRWFYSYAAYDSGKWVAYCVPADHLPPPEPK